MRKLVTLILILCFVSCQKNEDPVSNVVPGLNEEVIFFTEVLNEYVTANEIYQDVVNNVRDAIVSAEASISGKVNNNSIVPSITVEPFDLETFPKTITVDFGSGTTGVDGITRRGVVTIESTGWYGQQGSVHTTTFRNFFHEVFKVEGTQVVENFGENQDGNSEFGVTVEDGRISSVDGVDINFDEISTRIWIAGSGTPLNIWDDEYLLDGLQWGFSSDGTAYKLAFDQPIHYVLLPRNIKSGIVDLEIGGVTDIKINYNNRTTTILGVTSSF